ncbi:MAG: hypothetical protein JKY43_02770 [Phycisphaerales bacterium]|nr:hypothetical protein [Phycisphaerales bacterium]
MSTRARMISKLSAHRRGIASVLAMMFLVLFGSLIAAMAVSSTGNIRTANMHLHVMRAMSAAETGLAIAEHRLNEASSRFIVAQSEMDQAMSWALWTGNGADIGIYQVLPPTMGYSEDALPTGIAEALTNIHAADVNFITGLGYLELPEIQPAPGGVDAAVYAASNWVNTPAVMIEDWDIDTMNSPPPAYQIRYAPLAGGQYIRVIVEGIVYDLQRNSQPIRRTIIRDYRIAKSVDQAILAHSKILIGKNVSIEGDLGTRFDEVDFNFGDPIVMRSDFHGLDPDLDSKIEDFWASLSVSDVDHDNRLRIGHPTEGAGIPSDVDLDGDTVPDGAFNDATGDGYLDEFDIFIRHYDSNGDNRVTLSTALIEGTPAETAGAVPEFEGVDEDLALLIDQSRPDRNKNGVYGFVDANGNGRYEPVDENPVDVDNFHGVFSDLELGWRDGYIDLMDRYAKVSGSLVFKVVLSDWETAQGPIEERVQGPIVPGEGDSPMVFGADDTILPDINASSFVDTETALMAAADGDAFWQQVADQLGVGIGSLATWTLADNSADLADPQFLPVYDDLDFDGLPDNSGEAYWERTPFNSPNYSDIYWRPVFSNMVFRNVQIPEGLNGLFNDCTFVGVTYIRSHADNTHPLWQEYGLNMFDVAGNVIPKYARYVYGDDAGEDAANSPPMLPATAIPPNEFILMIDPGFSPIDKGDVPLSEIGSYGAAYDTLLEPLVIDGLRVVDTKELTNNIRFHDSLFVGSIVSDTPTNYTQLRNKVQFTGATKFTTVHPTEPGNAYLNPDSGDMDDILTSSMMLPNYSVDLGSFNSPPEQDVQLNGAIIAGVLDARGNTQIDGSLLLTFNPEYGVAPLMDVLGAPIGNPAGFNASLGYFGGLDGDFESLDPATLPIVGGVAIVGYDTTGDGLADAPHDQPQPPGSTPVPFNGYGKIIIRHDPNMRLPSGLMLPLSMPPVAGSYQEGSI